MKINNIKYIIFGAALVFGIDYINAQWTPPTGSAPIANRAAVVHTGIGSQVKQKSLGINNYLSILGDARFNQGLFLNGTVKGSSGVVSFGGMDNSISNPIGVIVNIQANGDIRAKQQLQSHSLANTENKRVCATSTGRLILCYTPTTVD